MNCISAIVLKSPSHMLVLDVTDSRMKESLIPADNTLRLPLHVVEADYAFVEGLQARSPAAWTQLYDEYFPKLQRFAWVRLRSVQEAEEVPAITFQRALEKIPSYTYRNISIGAWLYKIAENVIRERLRKVGREAARQYSGDQRDLLATSPSLNIDLRLDLTSALGGLSREQREVICLVSIAGFSVKEASEILGKGQRCVYYAQARGLHRLRALLSE